MTTIGIRELRNNVAAVVRRAAAGERLVVTSGGTPVAMLGPLEPAGGVTMDDLVAAGLVRPPGRSDHPAEPDPAILPVDVRVDRVVADVRGE